MTNVIIIGTVVLWLVFAVPTISNLNRAKKRLAEAEWRLAKRRFVHAAKFVAGRAASWVLGSVGGAAVGQLLNPQDAHASTTEAAVHHSLGHAAHVVHEWLPVIGWGWAIKQAVSGYRADPEVSSSSDEVEMWTRIVGGLRKTLAAQTLGAIVIVILCLALS